MTKLQALHSFWSSFGLKAYDETSVPDNATMPYITYEVSSDDFGSELAQTGSIWYRSTSWTDITNKEAEIAEAITRGGKLITYDGGAFWIKKGTPWAQRMSDPNDDAVRRMLLNVTIEFLN